MGSSYLAPQPHISGSPDFTQFLYGKPATCLPINWSNQSLLTVSGPYALICGAVEREKVQLSRSVGGFFEQTESNSYFPVSGGLDCRFHSHCSPHHSNHPGRGTGGGLYLLGLIWYVLYIVVKYWLGG